MGGGDNWGEATNRTRTSHAIYRFAGYNEPQLGVDLALVYLDAPFLINGVNSGFINQIYLEAHQSLKDKIISLYGLGYNNLSNQGFGTWRTANVTINSIENNSYSFSPNERGQIIYNGDSGGPHFIGSKIVGIQSGMTYNCIDNCSTITEVVSGFATSLPTMNNMIQAVRATQWNPSATTSFTDVFFDEIEGTKHGFDNVNNIGWAQAARSANAMCFNRGFVGGHFTGHYIEMDERYGLQCSGNGTAWYDATTDEISRTGYGFIDTNIVHWAFAGRAATSICEGFSQNFVGGHFNGHQSNGRYGLICYTDGAQWFDATISELLDTGDPVNDVNTVNWARAARAASTYCSRKGFSGGFLNGHQSDNKIGVVCQGITQSTSRVPLLRINYTSGASGSYFSLTGENFTPNTTEELLINGRIIGSVSVDDSGEFRVVLITNGAFPGDYTVTTSTPNTPTLFSIHVAALPRAKEGTGPELLINSSGMQNTIYMPLLRQ